MRSWIFSITTPIFSVTWSSEIILIGWSASQKHFLLLSGFVFQDTLMNWKFKRNINLLQYCILGTKVVGSSTFLLWCSTQKVIFEVCNDMRASTRWLSNSCLNYFFKCICEGRIASDWNAVRGSQQTDGKIYHHNHHHRHLWFSSSI